MQVLVTGGAGFIGSHVTAVLVAEGYQVRVLDDLSAGRRANLDGLPIELIVGDVRDRAVVNTAVSGCELLFHQAAFVSAPRSLDHPEWCHQVNVDGAFNVFEAARQAGVRRVVYASSSAIYGNRPGLPKREDAPPAPASPYAATKLINEVMAAAYTAVYGLELVGLRYMNVFGPRQLPSSPYSGVLSLFCQAAISGKACTIYGDGEQTRDFVYVADVAQANLLAGQVGKEKWGKTAVFNIGSGQQTSLNQVVAMLEEIVKRPIPVRYQEERPGDVGHSVADISRAQQILGFQPQTTLLEGLQATLKWMRAHEMRAHGMRAHEVRGT